MELLDRLYDLYDEYLLLKEEYGYDILKKPEATRLRFLESANEFINKVEKYSINFESECPESSKDSEECLKVLKFSPPLWKEMHSYIVATGPDLEEISKNLKQNQKASELELKKELEKITEDLSNSNLNLDEIKIKSDKDPFYQSTLNELLKFIEWWKPSPEETKKWDKLFLQADTTFEKLGYSVSESLTTRWGLGRMLIASVMTIFIVWDWREFRRMRLTSKFIKPKLTKISKNVNFQKNINSTRRSLMDSFSDAYKEKHKTRPSKQVSKEFADETMKELLSGKNSKKLTERKALKIITKQASKYGLVVSARFFSKFIPYIGLVLEFVFLGHDFCSAVVDGFEESKWYEDWGECFKVAKDGLGVAGGDFESLKAAQSTSWDRKAQLDDPKQKWPNDVWEKWPREMQCLWCFKNSMKKPMTTTLSGEKVYAAGPGCEELCTGTIEADNSNFANNIIDSGNYKLNRRAVKNSKLLGSFPYVSEFPKTVRYGIERNAIASDKIYFEISDHHVFANRNIPASELNRRSVQVSIVDALHKKKVRYSGGQDPGGVVGYFDMKYSSSMFDKLLKTKKSGIRGVFIFNGSNDDYLENETDMSGLMTFFEATFKKISKKYTIFKALKDIYNEGNRWRVGSDIGKSGRDFQDTEIRIQEETTV